MDWLKQAKALGVTVHGAEYLTKDEIEETQVCLDRYADNHGRTFTPWSDVDWPSCWIPQKPRLLSVYPAWFNPVNKPKEARDNVYRGMHPSGAELLTMARGVSGDYRTCGQCRWKLPFNSRCDCSDFVVKHWPACAKFSRHGYRTYTGITVIIDGEPLAIAPGLEFSRDSMDYPTVAIYPDSFSDET